MNNLNKKMLSTKPKQNTGFPWYVTGMVEADGCFSISFEKSKTALSGFRIKPIFTITQHQDNKNILEAIQEYLVFTLGENQRGKGRIVEHNNVCSYELRSVNNLFNRLLPHFKEYPLMGIKKINYKIFEKVIMILFEKKHIINYKFYNKVIVLLVWSMNTKGLNRSFSLNELLNMIDGVTWTIIPGMNSQNLSYKNKQLSELELNGNIYTPEKYSDMYINNLQTNYKSEIDLSILKTKIIDPNYVTGLIDGDGSFYFSHRLRNKRLNIVASFTLGQHEDSYILLIILQNYFNCGTVNKVHSNHFRLTVSKLSDIWNIIIPHFTNYPIIGLEKKRIFEIYKEGCLILNTKKLNKEKLSPDILYKLKTLTINMNKKGKYRINK